MRRIDIEPTIENIANSLSEDSLGRHKDLIRFLKRLNEVEPPYTIFIDGKWGDGKTFFTKQVIELIKDSNPELTSDCTDACEAFRKLHDTQKENTSYLPIYFNAWENDHYEDPICPLICEIVQQIETQLPTHKKSILEAGAAVLDTALAISSIFFPIPAVETGISNAVEKLRGEDVLASYKRRMFLREQFGTLIESTKCEKANTVVLFVDELDRCRPGFTIQFLEQIKQLVNRDDVIVVCSTDSKELAKSLAGIYGESFDSEKYLTRFCDKRFELSSVNEYEYMKRYGIDPHDDYRSMQIVKELLPKYSTSLRERDQFSCDLLKLQNYMHSKRSNTNDDLLRYMCVTALLPVYVLLAHFEPDRWRNLRDGVGFEELYDTVKDSEMFIKTLDCAVSQLHRNTENYEPTEEDRRNIVKHSCALIFLDDHQDSRRLEAYQNLEIAFWGSFNIDLMRNLIIPE